MMRKAVKIRYSIHGRHSIGAGTSVQRVYAFDGPHQSGPGLFRAFCTLLEIEPMNWIGIFNNSKDS